jgi:hypothetical protein
MLSSDAKNVKILTKIYSIAVPNREADNIRNLKPGSRRISVHIKLLTLSVRIHFLPSLVFRVKT